MGLKLEYTDGQTPLSEEAREGLKLKSITTQAELNEHEQHGIQEALKWLITARIAADEILTEAFIKKLHRKMFGHIWTWAGVFRLHSTNIGCAPAHISTELKMLLDDTNYWIENKTYSHEEIAIRFKHRLVSIHCFANGNGRHARIMADTIMERIFGEAPFRWNQSELLQQDESRQNYIAAIRRADIGEIEPLVKFAKS